MGTRGAFVIPVRDLDAAGRDYAFAVPAGWLRGALEACEVQPAGADGQLGVLVSKTGRDVVVHATLTADLVVPCARCLAPVRLEPRIEISLVLTAASPQAKAPAGARGGGKRAVEDEFSAEDADAEDTYEGDEVTLDRFVREAILLESPIFPLCSEACEGIRPIESAGPPARSEGSQVGDPRLLPLLELVKKRTIKE
jgi:uncharacterized protein